MNTKEAYSLGVDSGLETARFGDFSENALRDHDEFLTEADEIVHNKRQFADSPTYEFAREPNSEALFDAFDRGETVGLNKGWRQFHAKEAAKKQAFADMESDIESGECATINDKGEVYFCGELIDDCCDEKSALRTLREYMSGKKFWPNVYRINERGNVSQISARTGKPYKGREWV